VGLTVAAQGPQTGYSRDLFPHWIIQSGKCDTREVVLKRDGTGVVTSSTCAATSGTWVSPYDGATWTKATDVDIDHLVPLSNAWKVSPVLDLGRKQNDLILLRSLVRLRGRLPKGRHLQMI
jgi:hypothetical protein